MRHGSPLTTPAQASRSVGDILGVHHRELELGCLEMLTGLADVGRQLSLRWERIEYAILEHMAAEERMLFSVYQHTDPGTARALLDEHELLRERALEIGLAIHLRTIRSEHLQQFVDKLRGHARHEEVSMYRWAQRNLDQNQRRTLYALVR
jgi:hypothetical protein